jgi:hypothetical protein
MKPHTDSFDSSISDELRQVRTDALDHTASAIRSIRRQKELTIEEGIEGIGEIVTAESSAEDAMFFLAAATALDDDDRLREILDSYELGDRFSVSDED